MHEKTGALYARAKVVLKSALYDPEQPGMPGHRGPGLRGFLMTEELEPADVFRDGEHLVVFNDKNVIDLVGRFLDDEGERMRIASNGHAEAQRYRVENQAKRIMNVAEAIRGLPISRRS